MYLTIYIILFVLLITGNDDIIAQDRINEPEKAREIASLMIDRDDGRKVYTQVQLVTCQFRIKNGVRVRSSNPVKKSIETLRIDVGKDLEDTISLGIINDPPAEKNMAFLQKDYDEEGKVSDQWMYFPAMKKLKRIVSQSENSPRDGSVFGSEISYEDIEKTHVSNYTYSYEDSEEIDKRLCDKIAAYPTAKYHQKTSYGKEIFWIDQETRIAIKREMYDKRDRLVKTFYCRDIVNIDGVFLNKVRVVINHDTKRMTMEKILMLAVNIPIEQELVGLRALKDTSYRESKLRVIRSLAK